MQKSGIANLTTYSRVVFSGFIVAAAVCLSPAAQAAEEGLALAKSSGCLACHSVDKKVVGPAWKDVANKYRDGKDISVTLTGGKKVTGAPIDVLQQKVAKGGTGNWGTAAMIANSPKVSDEDIKKLVTFVLKLS